MPTAKQKYEKMVKANKPTGSKHVRAIGRLDDDRWFRLKLAAAASGLTFSEWAWFHLETAAEKEEKARKKK